MAMNDDIKKKIKSGELEEKQFTAQELLAYFDAGYKIINTETGKQYTRLELIRDLVENGSL